MRALLLAAAAATGMGALAQRGPAAVPVPAPLGLDSPAPAPRPLPALAAAHPGPWAAQIERPLFEPTRRPPEPPAQEAEAPPAWDPPPPTAAAGIVVGPAGPVVLLRLADGRLARAGEGAEVEGWQVARIAPTSVELRRGDRVLSLSARLAAPEQP